MAAKSARCSCGQARAFLAALPLGLGRLPDERPSLLFGQAVSGTAWLGDFEHVTDSIAPLGPPTQPLMDSLSAAKG